MFVKNEIVEYHDMFNRFNTIKKIKPNYLLCFDNLNKLFIIINSANYNEICLKFSNICSDFEKLLQKTLITNSSKLLKSIEENNLKLESIKLNNSKQSLIDKLSETQKFLLRTNKILPSDINKIIGVKNV